MKCGFGAVGDGVDDDGGVSSNRSFTSFAMRRHWENKQQKKRKVITRRNKFNPIARKQKKKSINERQFALHGIEGGNSPLLLTFL